MTPLDKKDYVLLSRCKRQFCIREKQSCEARICTLLMCESTLSSWSFLLVMDPVTTALIAPFKQVARRNTCWQSSLDLATRILQYLKRLRFMQYSTRNQDLRRRIQQYPRTS